MQSLQRTLAGTPTQLTSRRAAQQVAPLLQQGQAVARARAHPKRATVTMAAAGPSAPASSSAAPARAATAAGSMPSTSGRQETDYFAQDKRPIVLFDGVCNICNGGVNFMLDNDAEGKFRFAALQSGPGRALLQQCGRGADDISSVVLVEPVRRPDGRLTHYIKSAAALRIGRQMNAPWSILALFGWAAPRFILDPLYDQVANNRYRILGKRNMCRLSDPRFGERFLGA